MDRREFMLLSSALAIDPQILIEQAKAHLAPTTKLTVEKIRGWEDKPLVTLDDGGNPILVTVETCTRGPYPGWNSRLIDVATEEPLPFIMAFSLLAFPEDYMVGELIRIHPEDLIRSDVVPGGWTLGNKPFRLAKQRFILYSWRSYPEQE